MNTAFIAHILDLMSGWRGVTAKRMFSGHGLFHQGLMFGLIVRDTLYFKTTDHNRADFETAGMMPFTYVSKSRKKTVVLPYHEAPSELFDEPEEMVRWGRKALDAAMAARNSKSRKYKSRK